MRTPRCRLWIVALVAGLMIAAPGAARAQAPRVSPAAATPLVPQPGRGDLRMPPVDLFELSRHAGWGAAIGAGLGLAYGLAFERGSLRRLEVLGDTLIGFTAGLVGGTAVYVAKLALRR